MEQTLEMVNWKDTILKERNEKKDKKLVMFRRNIIIAREYQRETYLKAFAKNNKALVVGQILSFEFSHIDKEDFCYYKMFVHVLGMQKEYNIPVIISEKHIKENNINMFDLEGKYTEIAGTFCSHNDHINGHSYLRVFITARKIEVFNTKEELLNQDIHLCFLRGYICTNPVLKKVRENGTKIVYFILSVKRAYGKNDYIPCVAFNQTAIDILKDGLGKRIEIYGLIQRRKFFKTRKNENMEVETVETNDSEIELEEKQTYEVFILAKR